MENYEIESRRYPENENTRIIRVFDIQHYFLTILLQKHLNSNKYIPTIVQTTVFPRFRDRGMKKIKTKMFNLTLS